MLGQGRIIVHTGDGKGKTTAAFGAALRAAGHGHKVAVLQFIKGNWDYGEVRALAACPNVELTRVGSGFTWLAEDPAEPRRLAREAWQLARELALSDRYDLLVLDELNCAVAEGYVAPEEVVGLLVEKPQRLSVIITGRGATAELIDAADTVTEMRCIKHAFTQGVPARRGIEY
ncbi:MAG: cob(I)yrinic acid a,c-diamide adenosyltransferase [Actinobacteria bacterium RBG_16_64_13]|nr:MAG: cob(I)yrinic acid a,c-diamide adenosyltransferase [Actinobacteria bacterium RBG_16_64_13]